MVKNIRGFSFVFVLAATAMLAPFAVRGAWKAPEFSLTTGEGTTYSSAAHKGHRIVISFYKGYY